VIRSKKYNKWVYAIRAQAVALTARANTVARARAEKGEIYLVKEAIRSKTT